MEYIINISCCVLLSYWINFKVYFQNSKFLNFFTNKKSKYYLSKLLSKHKSSDHAITKNGESMMIESEVDLWDK